MVVAGLRAVGSASFVPQGVQVAGYPRLRIWLAMTSPAGAAREVFRRGSGGVPVGGRSDGFPGPGRPARCPSGTGDPGALPNTRRPAVGSSRAAVHLPKLPLTCPTQCLNRRITAPTLEKYGRSAASEPDRLGDNAQAGPHCNRSRFIAFIS